MKGMFTRPSQESVFGDCLDLDIGDADLIIVCTNNGSGWKPVSVLLPHQLYKETVTVWIKEDQTIFEVAAFPVSSDSYITAWEKK